jgi:translocation and assembly module TamB
MYRPSNTDLMQKDTADTAAATPGRGRRAIAAVAKTFGLGVVLALATAGGALLHLGLGAPRRFATAQVNSLLEGSFKGKIDVQRVGLLRLNRIGGVEAEVFDPEGGRVLHVYGVNARFGTLTLLRSLVRGKRLVVHIPELVIDGAEVALEENAAGELGLQRAFESPTPDTGEPSRGTEVAIDHIRLGHAWVHGHMAAVPLLDGDLKDVAAAFVSTPETTDIDVDHLFAIGRGLPAMNPHGTVEARASLPADPKDPTRVSARYEGLVGDIAVRADGSLTGKQVIAVLDVPETTPDAIARLAPDQIHLGDNVSAHAEVHGELPVLKPALHAWIGHGEITAAGTVTLPDETRPEETRKDLLASARVNVRDLDVSLVQEGAPESRLTAALDAAVVSRPGGKLTGTFLLDNQVGEVAGQVVPEARVQGEFTERSVAGAAQIAERGAPTSLWFTLEPRGGDGSPTELGGASPELGSNPSPTELGFRIETTVPDLDGIQRIGPIGRGRAHVVVDGGLDLATKRASVNASGELAGLSMKGVQLARGFVTGSAEGSLDALDSLRFQASVHGGGMRAGGQEFSSVRASASGTAQELDVVTRLMGSGQSPHLAARAHISNRKVLGVSHGHVRIEREDQAVTANIGSVSVANGTVSIRGVTAFGLGDPIEASARIFPSGMSVKAKGTDVDLSRVAKLLAREEDARGHLAFDVDAATTGRTVKGRVDARIQDLTLRGIEGASIRVSTALTGTHLHGEVQAALGEIGKIDLLAPDIELGGPAMEPSAWKTATGSVALAGAIDLDKLLARIPRDYRLLDSASGTVTLRGDASRSSRTGIPALHLEASTNGLALVGRQQKQRNPDGTVTLGPEPWRTRDLDGDFAVKLDGSTGGTRVSAKLHDKHGALVWLDASAKLPISEMMKTPDRLAALVRETPIQAKVAVPRRSLDAMPQALGTLPVKGEVELTAELEGTTRAPKITLSAKGTNLIPRRAGACMERMNVETNVAYDGERATVKLAATGGGRELLGADATVNVNAAQAMEGGEIKWEASGNVALSRFPLDAAGILLDKPIAGNVSGKIALGGLHRAATLEADLDLQGLTVDRSTIPRGKVSVAMKDDKLQASARLDQSDGFAEVTATGVMSWGAALAPDVDLTKTVEVGIRAKNFRANAAMPFVQGTLEELDGRIDADAKLHIGAGAKDGQMTGAVTLREGVFEVPQIGERFHALQGRVLMKPWGTIRFEEFSAEGPTGKLTASAEAVLKGLTFQKGSANIRIQQGQSIPITVEGVPMGRAYGEIKTTAQMAADGKRLDVNVDIPMLHVDLPQSTGHSVQPLEPDKKIRIGRHAGSDFALIPLAPPEEPRAASDMAVHAAIKLGDVEVKRDTTVFVVATGKTNIAVTDKARVGGQIRLERGKLELQGKQFIIDRGTVSFVGNDPADPLIMATAYWDAPDATRVYADFSGRVSSGKLALRSEPALSQDEILSLIMFGSRDGTFGAQPPPGREESTGVKAAGMAGGILTDGLNKAISGITTADISTRVDTSDASSPRPELAVQITRTVSARLGYKLGVPAPGENPDRTELTLEWRFIRNWSLVTVVGDQGSTSMDVVWRLRY